MKKEYCFTVLVPYWIAMCNSDVVSTGNNVAMITWYVLVHDMKEQREHKRTLRKYFYIHLNICPLICLLVVFSVVLVLCIV